MKYEKDKEHKDVAKHMRFVDHFGNEIPNCISFDTETGIAEVWEPEHVHSGSLVKRTKYFPAGMAIIEEQARPDEEHMQKVREKHTGKKEREK